MATYKVKAYGKEYTVEVIEQASGARIIVEGYSFEVEQAAPGSVPGQSASRAVATRPAAMPPAAVTPAPLPATIPAGKKKGGAKAAAAPAPAPAPAAKATGGGGGGRGAVCAPIPGVITKVCVVEGETVTAGQVVVKLEAMKMENDITALVSGTVKQVAVTEGAEVADGQLLVLVD